MKLFLTLANGAFAVLIGFLLGAWVVDTQQWVTATALESNRYALETSLIQGIEAYHNVNGHYPDSLDEIKVEWLEKNKERRKSLLKVFYYENRGTSYLLWWPRARLEGAMK